MGDSKRFYTAKVAAGVTCLGTAILLGASSWSAEPEKVKAVISEQTKTEQAAGASQKKIEQLDDETSKAGSEYRRALAEAQSLKGYNDQLAEQVKSQAEQIADFNR